ncbi:MAG: hypothetical protein R2715_12300 [Ilumatobacteraceae bacterium]
MTLKNIRVAVKMWAARRRRLAQRARRLRMDLDVDRVDRRSARPYRKIASNGVLLADVLPARPTSSESNLSAYQLVAFALEGATPPGVRRRSTGSPSTPLRLRRTAHLLGRRAHG